MLKRLRKKGFSMTEPAESIFNVIRWTVFKETGFQESSLKIGVPDFDKLCHGVRRGDFLIFASDSKDSQEKIILHLVKRFGIGLRCRTLVLLMDSSLRYFSQRVLKSCCDLSIQELDPEIESMQPVADVINDAPVYVSESTRLTLAELEEHIESVRPEIVLISGADKLIRNENAYDEKSMVELSRALKDLAQKYSCAVVLDVMLPFLTSPCDQIDAIKLPFNGAIASEADLVLEVGLEESSTDKCLLNVIKSVHGYSGSFDLEV